MENIAQVIIELESAATILMVSLHFVSFTYIHKFFVKHSYNFSRRQTLQMNKGLEQKLFLLIFIRLKRRIHFVDRF